MQARKQRITFRVLAIVGLFFAVVTSVRAQTIDAVQSRSLITQTIDDSRLARLSHHTRGEANRANDRGAVADDLPLPHMQLQLQRSPAQEQALQQYIDQLQDPTSANFHHWLTPDDFGTRFGLAPSDLQAIETWLAERGFAVNFVYPNGTVVDFSGTAGQVRLAFHTEIHDLSVGGTAHIANMSDPQIPAALSGAVVGVVGLNDFKPHRQYRPRPSYTVSSSAYLVAPADLATIYNLNPLFSNNVSGLNQTIVVVEDTNVYSTADWSTFRSTFGLSGYLGGSFTQVHPQATGGSNCANPGVNSDDGEAILDAEWASAAAPSAAIVLASCNNSTTGDGLLVAIQNLVNGTNPPPIISVSYGECEANNTDNASYNAIFQQAVAEGISVFVAAGDWGAAVCDASFDSGVTAQAGIAVNGLASTPYNVAVGGTDFGDTYQNAQSTYWNSTNSGTFGSAKSYVPEVPWNNTCANTLIAAYFRFSTTYGTNGLCNSSTARTNQWIDIVAGSGGPSTLYSKPSWQAGMAGIQSDGKRDLPDVSLFAGSGILGHYYVFCYSDPGNNRGGAPCTGAPNTWAGGGGTSFASPILAGMQALVNQQNGGAQGNPNPIYYALATAEYGTSGNSSCNSSNGNGVGSSCIFYDVTQGDNDVPCTGTTNCYQPSGTIGVLSTSNSNYQKAYGTAPGWDFATGIGSVNATNLVKNWKNILSVTIVGSGTVTDALGIMNCSSGTCSRSYPRGQNVSLSTTPAAGWYFVGFNGACAQLSLCIVTMNGAPVSLTATFVEGPMVPITVTVNQGGTVTSSPPGISCINGSANCTTNFVVGQQVTLTAVPATSATSMGFSGNATSNNPCGPLVCTFTVAGPVNETVTFGTTVSVVVTGKGTVTSSTPTSHGDGDIWCGTNNAITCQTTYPIGQQVTMATSPVPGWAFYAWGGNCSGTGSCIFTLSNSTSLSAYFAYTGLGGGSAGNLNGINTWSYVCADSSFDKLNNALVGTAPWSFTTSAAANANGKIGQPQSGDVILITNECLGDITITTDNLTVTNHNDNTQAPIVESPLSDGIIGQVEVTGARNVNIRNLMLDLTTLGNGETAALFTHDRAFVTAANDAIASGSEAIHVAGNAGIILLNSSAASDGNTIVAQGQSTVRLGNTDGTLGVEIVYPANGFIVDLRQNSSAEIYGSLLADYNQSTIYASGDSHVRLVGSTVEPGSTWPAIQIMGNSSLALEALANGTPTVVNGGVPGAILASGNSVITLNSATVTSVSGPAIEASVGSSLILAGGNTIKNTASGGLAVQIDHSSSLSHLPGSQLGFTNAAETLAGAGSIQEQSTIDLGQGLVNGQASIVWDAPNGSPITIQQNSSFRLSGGATIGPSNIRIQQGSNAFLSTDNGGTNSAHLVCVSSANDPGVHVADSSAATPSVATTSLSAALAGAPSTPGSAQANTCLGF